MKIYRLFGLLAATCLIGACDFDLGIRGNGHVTTTQQQVGSFSQISGSGALRVEWRSGAPSLSVTTDENLMQYFEAVTNSNTLQLRMRERVRPTHGIKIVVTSPSLNGAKLSGAADLTAHGLTGQAFAVKTTGAATVVLDGTVSELLADMTGASELKAKDLHTEVVEISTTGAADAWITVSQKLRVAITGAGTVNYSGNPPTIERHITGAGTIRHKE